MNQTIRPMPAKVGVGFVSQNKLNDDASIGYRYEPVGTFHNYHFTLKNFDWPVWYDRGENQKEIIDAFSPNMNKELHVGHLRQLALAASLSALFRWSKQVQFVAILGCSLGVKQRAIDSWTWWTNFVNYAPKLYYDVILPDDVILTYTQTEDGSGPSYWNGPNGPVIVKREDGRPLYAYYDLAFAEIVGPTKYITGTEQKEHFEKLDLKDKHLAMGLVLGEDGTKLKSRSGDAMLAKEAMQAIIEQLNGTPEYHREHLAWNILAWNMLHASRESNLKFEAETWSKPDAPGLYITYTNARLMSALGDDLDTYDIDSSWKFEESDLKILGICEYHRYYLQKSLENMDPAPIANYAHELARVLGNAYEKERIKDGRKGFVYAIKLGTRVLQLCMKELGMFLIDWV